jgi:flagellar protein FliO/FliZ
LEDVSLFALFARLAISLAVVLGAMALGAKLLKKRGIGGTGGRIRRVAPIEVMARHGLGRTASVAMVRAGGKVLVLGVTDSSVSVLAEADPDAIEVDDDPPGGHWTAAPSTGPLARTDWTWKAMIDAARDRTVRRS